MTGIGMSFSGGGSRAAAFHLGSLRALHELGVLPRVQVLSAVSGGALMAALWAYHPGDFTDFERDATGLLRRGLHWEITTRALRPLAAARSLVGAGSSLLRPGHPRPTRTTTRTDALADALAAHAFGDRLLTEPRVDCEIVLTTTDLVTGKAVRFGSSVSSSSEFGRLVEPWRVADAVAASAAFPALLPAMERTVEVVRAGQTQPRHLLLADGGLYDNLGLSVLEPGRSRHYTDHVYDLDRLILCDAGRGPLKKKATHFWGPRMRRSVEIMHKRSEDQGRRRIHEWSANGQLKFTMAYLGMNDTRLPVPAPDLVARERVDSYPTDFAAMAPGDLEALAGRGEGLIRALLPFYCPDLLP